MFFFFSSSARRHQWDLQAIFSNEKGRILERFFLFESTDGIPLEEINLKSGKWEESSFIQLEMTKKNESQRVKYDWD